MESPSTTKHREIGAYRLYRLGFLGLGVMCILQASLNVTLRLFANSTQHNANLTSEEDLLQTHLRHLTEEKAQLQFKNVQLLKELDQSLTETQICNNSLQREAETANSTQHNANLTSEEDQLQTHLRCLTEEKAQLQIKYAQLLKELDQSLTETQICNNSLQREAVTATSRISGLTSEKVQLQTRYDQLRKELDQTRKSLQRKAEIVEKTCPAGWRKRDNRMYFISKGTKSWSQSREDCRERGSDLVIINSLGEQRFIQNLGMQVWIGLREISSRWTWVDGSSLKYLYWRTGEPNEYRSGEDCAESKPDYDSLNTWNDERCHVSLNWVCEREVC